MISLSRMSYRDWSFFFFFFFNDTATTEIYTLSLPDALPIWLIKPPMVTTIHGFSSPKIIPVYKKYNDTSYYVSISNSDRSRELDYIATVYNGINPKGFHFQENPDDFLLYFGRIHPEKGTYEAIQIARKAGRRLIISGLIQDEEYFEAKVKPWLDDKNIIYVGNSGPRRRNELLGRAYALLHPISFEEPFGLSVAEAMMCGTPVVAFSRGSMPELIVEGKTGFMVQTIEEAVAVLPAVEGIRRVDCHRYALENFSIDKMVDGYIEVYRKILSR